MITKRALIGTLATTLMGLATLPAANGQTASSSPWKTCAQENGITLQPGQSLTEAQRQQIRTCYKTVKKQALDDCSTAAGFTPSPGTKPSTEQRSTIHQCLAAMGFHHHRHHKNHETKPS